MTPHWILGRRHRMWRTLCLRCLRCLQRLWRPRRRWWRSQTTTRCRDKLKAQSELRLTKVSGQVVHSIFRVWRFFSSIPKFRWLGVLRAAIRVRFHVVRSFTVELKQKKLTQRFQNGTAGPVNCLLGCWFQRSCSPSFPPAHLGSWSRSFRAVETSNRLCRACQRSAHSGVETLETWRKNAFQTWKQFVHWFPLICHAGHGFAAYLHCPVSLRSPERKGKHYSSLAWNTL